ncbi:ABC transporter permease [Paenibacillaceae bacterium]|nr:ABC transporter permease [Paenibacillaceae bacterium]
MRDTSLWSQLVFQFESRWQDLLSATVTHVELVLISMLLAICIGIPLGILVTRVPSLSTVILGGAGMMQTIPSLAMLGFMIPIFGIGIKTAIAALFLYSLLPIIRNTSTGIKDVDKSTTEAARGMGLTSWQILFKVELPLALSVIMAGIRTAAVINVGTATLAAFIGSGGLGDFIFLGITRGIDALVLLGAIPAAILAIILELLLGVLERKTTPRGLKIKEDS